MPRRDRPIPLAYLLTFHTYGTWLHGRAPGSVDKQHNQFGAPFLPADPSQEAEMRERMSETAFTLDAPRRKVVRATVQEVSAYRGWPILALHVRNTHIHLVVRGHADPDKMLDDYKAYATRRLKEAGFDHQRSHRWTPGGSTEFLWRPDQVVAAVRYVVDRQGEPMEVYEAPFDEAVWYGPLSSPEKTSKPQSEPEA